MTDYHQSHIETFMTCPERYRRRYRDGGPRIEENNASNLIGTAEHLMLEQAALALRDHGEITSVEQNVSVALANFERLVAEDGRGPNPIPWEAGALDARTADVRRLAEVWTDTLPRIWDAYGAPREVEYAFDRLAIPGGLHTISGTADVLTERNVLIDWKNTRSGWGWAKGKGQKKIQRVFYSAGIAHGAVDLWPQQFVFVVGERTLLKKEQRTRYAVRQYPIDTDPQREWEFLIRLVNDYGEQEAAGIFPLNTSSGLCSVEWCPFWSTCPASALDPTATAEGGGENEQANGRADPAAG